MRFGFCGISSGLFARDTSSLRDIGPSLEQLGWDSVWAGEHYALPVRPGKPQAPPARTLYLDPFVALSSVASTTESLLLATGVIVVPVHQPAVLAKKAASLDCVSDGRFLFGVGVGYLDEEFAALGADLTTRGRRFEDALEVMRALWSGMPVTIANESFSMASVQARPKPVSGPGLRMIFGGYAPVSYRRAVADAQGWYGYWLDLDATAQSVAALRAAADEVERPDHLGPLEISVTPPRDQPVTPELVEEYWRLGVDRLVVIPPPDAFVDRDAMWRHLHEVAAGLDLLKYAEYRR